jgi:phage/plasmid-like protein (TIGR03299 family)
MDQATIDQLAANDPTFAGWGTTTDIAENKMRHEIDKSVGTAGGFSARYYGAWHELGTVINSDTATAEDLLKAAGADYEIFRTPVKAVVEMPIAPGSPITVKKEIDDPRGLMNICRWHPTTGEPEILGQASKDYPLWNNRDIFTGYADTIIDAAKPTASTCAVLYQGRRTVMSFELPDDIKVGGITDEGVRIWVVVLTSYDKSTPTVTYLTTIRPVCANTVRAGRAQGFATYVVKKTKRADLKVAMAREALALVPKFTEAAAAEWDELLKVNVTDAKFAEIIAGLWGPGDDPTPSAKASWDVKHDKLMGLFTQADTQANVRNTGYGAVQAVTEFADWESRIVFPANMTETSARLVRSINDSMATGKTKAPTRQPKIDITARVLELL